MTGLCNDGDKNYALLSYEYIAPERFYFGCEDGTFIVSDFMVLVLDNIVKHDISALVKESVSVNAMVRDSNGEMLIGTSKGYIVMYDPEKKELSKVNKVSGDINQMAMHSPVILLLATTEGVVVRQNDKYTLEIAGDEI